MFAQLFAIVFVLLAKNAHAETFASKLSTFKNETVSIKQ